MKNVDGEMIYAHSGGTYGFSSTLAVNPSAETAVIVLGNGMWFSETGELDMQFYDSAMQILAVLR